jgi:hypothetical protein
MSFDKRAYWEGVLGDGTRPPATDFVGFDLIAFDEKEGWAEAVMSVAGSIVQDGPAMAPTLQMTTSFIRPVPVGVRLIGRGEVVRKGRQAIFTQGFLSAEDGTLLAQATASCIPRSLA